MTPENKKPGSEGNQEEFRQAREQSAYVLRAEVRRAMEMTYGLGSTGPRLEKPTDLSSAKELSDALQIFLQPERRGVKEVITEAAGKIRQKVEKIITGGSSLRRAGKEIRATQKQKNGPAKK